MGDVPISSIGCPLYRRTRVACISTSGADLLRYPMRRLNSAPHPPIPSGRMFTRKEDPAFSASIDRNPVQFARTKRRKTAALPGFLAPALHSSRLELRCRDCVSGGPGTVEQSVKFPGRQVVSSDEAAGLGIATPGELADLQHQTQQVSHFSFSMKTAAGARHGRVPHDSHALGAHFT